MPKPWQFQPGNKLGRGRPKAFDEVQALARTHTKGNIERLLHWRDQDEDPATSLRATIAIHEIGWGKPVQVVEGTQDHTLTIRWKNGQMALVEPSAQPVIEIAS